MAKMKYAQHVLDNIRWFAVNRHNFDFSGSNYFGLKKVIIFSRLIGSNDWSFENEMSHASFCAAFGHDPKLHHLPDFTPGMTKEYKLELYSEPCIVHDVNGVSAVEAFIQIDSYGVVRPTRHSTLLFNLLRSKASLNLHIQMYAQDRANGRLPKVCFTEEVVEPFGFLPWMVEAVENQKWNYM